MISINNSNNLDIICGFGLLMGMIHVLTGADHLSALALLCVDKNSYESFKIGVTWGLGHSIGLIVVAIIFLAVSIEINLDKEGDIADKIVGAMMICLSGIGFYNAYKMSQPNAVIETIDVENGTKEPEPEPTTNSYCSRMCVYFDMKNPNNSRIASIFIGIIHGVSGPGAVLGLLPALALHNVTKSSIYLSSFCVASIIIMGTYAATWSNITNAIGNQTNIDKYNYYLIIITSSFSLTVGIVWLVLSCTGGISQYGL
jgi:hypothetical protein